MKPLLNLSHVEFQVNEFSRNFPKLSTQKGAVNTCKMISYELCKYLRSRGINALMYHVEKCAPGTYPKPHKTWADKKESEWSHYVVKVGSRCFDLSARQFDSNLPHPYTCSIAELRRTWDVVESDKFLNRLVLEFNI
jgi:hypothetical protein